MLLFPNDYHVAAIQRQAKSNAERGTKEKTKLKSYSVPEAIVSLAQEFFIGVPSTSHHNWSGLGLRSFLLCPDGGAAWRPPASSSSFILTSVQEVGKWTSGSEGETTSALTASSSDTAEHMLVSVRVKSARSSEKGSHFLSLTSFQSAYLDKE